MDILAVFQIIYSSKLTNFGEIIMLNKKFLATAAAFALTAAASASVFANTHQVQCMGINSCKGTGACKTSTNACKGQNSCKGQGFEMKTADECKAAGGKPMMMDNMQNNMAQ